jgi:PAS domain S-box-containing protein
MKILYVEDDPFDADLTRRALLKTAPDHQLDIARTQSEAMDLLALSPGYDLMLTDLRLPDGNGFALLSHVREHDLPMAVVVITGQGDEEIAVSVLKAGANDYLVKRQNYLDHLWLTLENAIEGYRAEVARRQRPLRVLYLDHNPNDIEQTLHHFASHAPHIHLQTIYTYEEMLRLFQGDCSTIEFGALMLDYQQQDLNALDLLKELRQVRRLDLPIILVTGQGDEELATQALRLGASDYVVKNPGYLSRLPGLLENAYHRTQLLREQAALRASEARFRRLAENAPDMIYRITAQSGLKLEYVSPAAQVVTGYSLEELYTDVNVFEHITYPEDIPLLSQVFSGKVPNGEPFVFRLKRKDGQNIWLEGRNVAIFDNDEGVVAHEGIIRDVTERKHAEENIQRQFQRLRALRTIDAAIAANLSLQNTLNVLLEQVLVELNVQAADIMLYNPQSELLEYGAGSGFSTDLVAAHRIQAGEGFAGQAILQGKIIHTSSGEPIASDPRLASFWDEEGFIDYFGAPLVAKEQIRGILEVYLRQPLKSDADWTNFLETLAGQAAIAIDNAQLLENLQRANRELTLAYDSTLVGWVDYLDLRDRETQNHTQRVTQMTLQLAEKMGIDGPALVHIRRGALLHDIGKIGIPDEILRKAGPLTEKEWDIMHLHPEYANNFLSKIDYLLPALDIPYCHHEKWDGSGYPRKLKEEQIPLAARIFAVVDVWDALSSDRPYRKGWEKEKVLEYIRSQSGSHFDPTIVDQFLQVVVESEAMVIV